MWYTLKFRNIKKVKWDNWFTQTQIWLIWLYENWKYIKFLTHDDELLKIIESSELILPDWGMFGSSYGT